MPDEALFLGLDLGTSGARAVVIDAAHRVRATAKSALADHGANPRDPAIWWAAAETALKALLEAVPLEEWVVALKGAEPELVRAITGAMPKRQAQQMESINRRQGPVPLSRVEQVRKDIMAVVREMSASGELQVQLFREQTVE